jgi:hypothetical protein
VHKNPAQVRRLVKKLYFTHDQFYVNIFGNYPSEQTWAKSLEEFRSHNFFVTHKYSQAWGTFKLVEATLNSMQYFADKDYDYFINISGQCYPLKSIEEIHSFFENKTNAFIDEFSLPDEAPSGWGKRGGLDRIQNSYYKNPFSKVIKLFGVDKLNFVKIPRLRRAIPFNLEPFGGSMWFCLPKKQVNYILDYIKTKSEIIDFFKDTLCSDEIFFQTLLMNSEYKSTVINDNLRLINWSTTNTSHPALMTISDADELLKSTKLFARKFDTEVDGRILDVIDRHFS